MANQITADGLTIDGLSSILNKLTTYFESIYGNVNLDQNSPDAQWINIMAQMFADYGELLQDINASFDPDQAVGVILDQRVKYNGITRFNGVYTTVEVTVNFSGSGTIKGLDLYDKADCFQVSDSTGNILVPAATTSGVTGDSPTVLFRAYEYGALTFPANSVNTIVTPTIGVASVNNAFAQGTVGAEQEPDGSVRTRRQVAANYISSYGGVDVLEAALRQIEGVTYATVKENDGSQESTDPDYNYINSIPLGGIWVILQGVYNYEEVAATIYRKRTLGTPMKGSIAYDITTTDGTKVKTIKWDNVKTTKLYVRITCLMYQQQFSAPNILAALMNINFNVGEMADTTTISQQLKDQVPSILINSLQISTDGSSWGNYLIPNFNEQLVMEETQITITEG